MRILFQSYNTCCQNLSGGVQNRVRKIHDLLTERGIMVDFFAPFSTRVENYDILHIFYLSPESFDLVRYTKQGGGRIVLSPIVGLTGGNILDFCRLFFNRLPILTAHKMSFFVAQNSDLLLTESKQEADFISKHYRIENEKFRIIPNGVNCEVYEGEDIYKSIGGVKKYVLQVGRFDKNKNQLNVIKALRDSKIDVVFVGGPSPTSEAYFDECRKIAADCEYFHFLGWQEPESPLLKSAYANADILILPSYQETFGLVVLEGAINGAKIAVSNTLPILEFDPFKNVATFNPSSIEDIRRTVISLLCEERNDRLKEDVKSFFSWNRIIDKHIECYEGLLDC